MLTLGIKSIKQPRECQKKGEREMRACTWSEEVAQGGTVVYPRPCTALLVIEQKLKIYLIKLIPSQ
jgi:hypothetical protein